MQEETTVPGQRRISGRSHEKQWWGIVCFQNYQNGPARLKFGVGQIGRLMMQHGLGGLDRGR